MSVFFSFPGTVFSLVVIYQTSVANSVPDRYVLLSVRHNKVSSGLLTILYCSARIYVILNMLDLLEECNCESVELNHFAIIVFCTSWNNNWIQLLFREV